MKLSSSAFEHNAPIPARFTGEGENVSPPLAWSEVPKGTKSFALVMDDPDAPSGTFHHWAVFDLTPGCEGLPEAVTDRAGAGPVGHGVNDFSNARYDGPLPPKGHGVHHYHFKLAALDVDHLTVDDPATVTTVWDAARRHALATAELIGTYER